jgi:hypothetical protein
VQEYLGEPGSFWGKYGLVVATKGSSTGEQLVVGLEQIGAGAG